MSKINKKRFFTFIFLIVLISIPVFVNDLIVRITVFSVLVIYVAFIIFLRDGKSKQQKVAAQTEKQDSLSQPAEDEIQPEVVEKSIITSTELRKMKSSPQVHSFKPSNLKEKFYEIACEAIPEGLNQDAQFNFILEKILNVIKSTLIANSAIFFWYNRKKNQLIIQSYVSDTIEIHKARFPLEDDIVSKVVRDGSPEILNNLNSNVEADLVKYYDNPTGIKSIVAVPVYFNDYLIGVLVVDCKSEDAFGIETVYLLGRFVRMITIVLGVFDEKFNVNIVNQKLEALTNLIGETEKNQDEKIYLQKIVLALDKLTEWDALSIILFDPKDRLFKIFKSVNRTSLRYVGEGLVVDVEKSLVGKAIQTGRSVKIEDVTEDKYPIFTPLDTSSFGGSLLVVPITYQNKTYGSLTFENLRKNFYSNKDVRFLEKIASYVASHFESISNIQLLNSYLSIDLETLLMNKSTFEKRIQEELAKSNITKINLGLAFLSIDNFDKLAKQYGPKVMSKLTKHVAVHLNKESDELMLNARIDTNKFAVLFFNRDDAESFLWCEKIRQKVVKDFINIDGGNINISLSIGFAGGRNHLSYETLFGNVDLVLRKAINSGGNCVRTYK